MQADSWAYQKLTELSGIHSDARIYPYLQNENMVSMK